jgi:glycosyltransferase involved in cell wall biosynthesis
MRLDIVTPAWNMAPWIGAAIRSGLAQTRVDWRMVVVDDGSTDDTPDVVWALFDERLTLLRQVHEGVSAARNRGLLALEPSCEAILFLDADDQLTPNALTRLVAGLRAAPHAVAAAGPWAMPGVCCAHRSAICSSRCCTATALPMAGTC